MYYRHIKNGLLSFFDAAHFYSISQILILIAEQILRWFVLVDTRVAALLLQETVVVSIVIYGRYLANHTRAILRPELMIHIRLEADALTRIQTQHLARGNDSRNAIYLHAARLVGRLLVLRSD